MTILGENIQILVNFKHLILRSKSFWWHIWAKRQRYRHQTGQAAASHLGCQWKQSTELGWPMKEQETGIPCDTFQRDEFIVPPLGGSWECWRDANQVRLVQLQSQHLLGFTIDTKVHFLHSHKSTNDLNFIWTKWHMNVPKIWRGWKVWRINLVNSYFF